MKKILYFILITNIYAQPFFNTNDNKGSSEKLTVEERLEKIEQKLSSQENDIEEKKKTDEKQDKDIQELLKENIEFHGYFRTGADGNLREGNKRAYDRAKNLVGRWGNEYDTNFNFNLSKKFILNNKAWSKVHFQIENWNNTYNNGFRDNDKLNLTNLYLEMGELPIFKGRFKDSTIVAGKRGWDGVIVDPIDYYYQDIGGTGFGINNIRIGKGNLSLAYISADFDDKTQHAYKSNNPHLGTYKGTMDVGGTIRGYKGRYAYKDIVTELMYAHAVDHNNVDKTYNDIYGKKFESTRNTADQGVYAGIYYNPKNFFGLKGWGQHYLQFSNGVLAGNNGIGRLNTPGNMLAHKESKAYQLGVGGLVNVSSKLNVMPTFRIAYTENVDSRDKEITASGKYIPSVLEKNNKLIGFNVRPIYTINPYVDLWIDAGLGKITSTAYNDDEWKGKYYKVSAGPQLRYSIGYAETTVKAYLTYIGEDIQQKDKVESTKKSSSDLIGGLQFVAWW